MGTVKRQLDIAREKVVFDFNGPDMCVSRKDRRALMAEAEALCILRWAAEVLASLGPDEAKLGQPMLGLSIDKLGAGDERIPWKARATKYLIRALVQTTFADPKTVKKKDRSHYGVWQRHLDYEAPDEGETTLGALAWLRDILDREEVGLPIEMSQWALAVMEYASDLYERTLAALATPEGEAGVQQ